MSKSRDPLAREAMTRDSDYDTEIRRGTVGVSVWRGTLAYGRRISQLGVCVFVALGHDLHQVPDQMFLRASTCQIRMTQTAFISGHVFLPPGYFKTHCRSRSPPVKSYYIPHRIRALNSRIQNSMVRRPWRERQSRRTHFYETRRGFDTRFRL